MSQDNSPKGKGGTVLIAQSPFAQPGAPQPPPQGGAPAPYGPPPGAPMGGPPMGGPPMGGPPMGAPMGGPPMGAPMAGQPMGGPPGQQMAGPPMGGYGQPMGGAPMVPAGGPGGGGGGPLGTIRNPVLLLVVSAFCCPYYGLYHCMKIEEELNRYLGKTEGGSILWMLFPLIPLLSMPKLIGEARARAGTATQGEGNLVFYILIGLYQLPKDANEIWERLGVRPT